MIKMPKRSRSRSTSRVAKRSRSMRRMSFRTAKFRRARRYRPMMTVVRYGSASNDSCSATAGESLKFLSFASKLSDLASYTDYTACFDQYKIKSVTFECRLCVDPSGSNQLNSTGVTNANNFFPDIYATVDHDDIDTLTTIDKITQYDKCKAGILRPNSWFKYRYHPNTLMKVARPESTDANSVPNRSAWCDCNQPDIPHYGLKVFVDPRQAAATTDLAQAIYFQYRFKYHLVFKAQR